METTTNGNGKKLIQQLAGGGVAATVLVAFLGLAWNTVADHTSRLAEIEQDIKSLSGRIQSLQKKVDRLGTMKQ